MIREYRTICDLSEHCFTASKIQGVTPGELGEVFSPSGDTCACQVLEVDGDTVLGAFLESPVGLATETCKVRFFGYGAELSLSEDLLGRTWNSLGEPLDGGSMILPEKYTSIDALPINPLARECRTETIGIMGEASIRLGEKGTVFSSPHNSIAKTIAQLARNAKIQVEDQALIIVISAIGVPFRERELLTDELRRRGLTAQTVVFASSPADRPLLHLRTAYTAITAAEYFAFERERHVLLIEADLSAETAVCAVLEERIGCRKGCEGSITMLKITM